MHPLTRDEALAFAAGVDGWLTPAEAALLFDLARRCRPSATIVEIGSWRGKSTVLLAAGAGPQGGRVFAIDPHEVTTGGLASAGVRTLVANLERAAVAGAVTPIVARAEDAAAAFDRPIDLLFIDGDHSEASARRDLEQWLPKVAAGGCVALHDIVNPTVAGARRALVGWLWRSRLMGRVRLVDSIAYAERVERPALAARAANWIVALALSAYGLRPGGLPPALHRVLTAAARLTPLKQRPR